MYFLVLAVAYFLAAMVGGLQHLWRGCHQPRPLAQELRSPLEEKATQARDAHPGAPPPAAEDSGWTPGPTSWLQNQQHKTQV